MSHNEDLQPTTMQSNLPREELPEQDLNAISGGDEFTDAMAAQQEAMAALAEQDQVISEVQSQAVLQSTIPSEPTTPLPPPVV